MWYWFIEVFISSRFIRNYICCLLAIVRLNKGIYLIYYNKNKDKDDKLIISKDLTEIKKKIIDGSMGKIVGEITNVSSNY